LQDVCATRNQLKRPTHADFTRRGGPDPVHTIAPL
jgi:hypothetical protein